MAPARRQEWSEFRDILTIMKTVGVLEAKTNLSKLLAEVEQGEELVITRHGQPVARVVPANSELSREEIAARWRRFIESGRALGLHLEPGETIKDLITDGRRF
ncbi:MAG TPA: type II toxin-antitoxin system prevent-host-death family antitoxin [Terriglobales bacterium]|nr:type II toxin-antitoxin system prevent-host-death family antitoxin [Terriglobales bacterium]